jgi:hypothetical protein
MPKLTDTQLVILSAAAQRRDRAVLPLPKSPKIKGACSKRSPPPVTPRPGARLTGASA